MKNSSRILTACSLFLSLSAIAADYQGSSFNEVKAILGNKQNHLNNKQAINDLKFYDDGHLPHYPVNAASIFGPGMDLVKDAKRTTNEHFDYYDYLPKKVHSNGICVTGQWDITQPSSYSGYFKQGSKALFIGRISAAGEITNRGEKRGFGFAGKLFPTLNENEVVKTTNFFTVDVLLGTKIDRFLDTSMTNEPELGFDFLGLPLIIRISNALRQADENPQFRPVSQIAKLDENGEIKSPHWIRISADVGMYRNDGIDFRHEVQLALEDNKNLKFNIDVSDKTSDRSKNDKWINLGQITINQAIVGFGCDRRLHFSHPKINDPK